MATILKNIVEFANLVIGVPTALPHLLNVNGIPVTPKLGGANAEGFTISADATNVTVTRTINAESGDVHVYVEYWHTIESVTPLVPPPGKLIGLTPFFFAASGNDPSPIVVEDDGVPLANPPHATLNFIGGGVQAIDAGGGVADITIPGFILVFRPGGVQTGNVYTSWADLVAAASLIEGVKIIQFDDSIVSPCVIPPGIWDMSQVEWFGMVNPDLGALVAITVSDGASFTNFQKMGGFIRVTNLNTVTAPVVVAPVGVFPPNGRRFFNFGRAGLTGDFTQIVNTGAAPFFDCTALLAGQLFILRGSVGITGGSPAVQFGASPGTLALGLFESRIEAGMIAGTNPAAIMNLAQFWASSVATRQDTWAGTINRGRPNSIFSAGVGIGGTPYVRTQLFPAPINQMPALPSPIPLTVATGLGMNVTMRLNAAAGVIAQPLPLIRAAAPAIGANQTVPGVLNSDGMIVIVREFSGMNGVSLTPAAGETIEGGAGPLLVPPGGSRILQSDGISDWRIIAGYL